MSSYPPRSQVRKLKRQKMNSKKEKLDFDEVANHTTTIDVLHLPSRKDSYKEKKQQGSEQIRSDKKKKNLQFPLVRILLVLFILLVSGMFTYSFLVQ